MGKRMDVAAVVVVFAIGMWAVGSVMDSPPIFMQTFTGNNLVSARFTGPTGAPITKIGTYQVSADVVERTYGTRVELPFDAASTECVDGRFALPHTYRGGKTMVCPTFWSAAATTGNATWEFRYAAVGPGASIDGTKSATSFRIAIPGTILKASRQCPYITDLPAGGQDVDFQLCRLGASPLDTLAGDALLGSVTIETGM